MIWPNLFQQRPRRNPGIPQNDQPLVNIPAQRRFLNVLEFPLDDSFFFESFDQNPRLRELLPPITEDKKKRKMAFDKYLAASKFGLKEADWMVAACYSKETVISRNYSYARAYAKKAMVKGSVYGKFWFASAFDSAEAFPYYVIAMESGSLQGRFEVAYCLTHGFGIKPDSERAKQLFLEVGRDGDAYYSAVVSLILKKGMFGFHPSLSEAKEMKAQAKMKETSHSSLFNPTRFAVGGSEVYCWMESAD